MNRKSNQVSLAPYGYTVVKRAPTPGGNQTQGVPAPVITSPQNSTTATTGHATVTPSSAPGAPAKPTGAAVQQSSDSTGCLIIGIFAIVVFIFFAVLVPKETKAPTYTSSGHDEGMACIMAEKMITPKLKAPTTAEFDYADCKDSATHSGNTWTLSSYVDADNSFGAHIRTHFTVKMTNVPPSDMWHMEIVYFGD